MKTFHLPYDTVIQIVEPQISFPTCGTISSKLGHYTDKKSGNALESLLLALACAGVDLSSDAFCEGMSTAVNAIAQRG